MKLSLALLLLIAITLPAAATAQPGAGPDLFEPGASPPSPPATLLAAPAQTGDACYPLLSDPNVDGDPAQVATPWRQYRAERLFSTTEFNTGPRSLYLRADRDGDPTSGPDVDAVGQEIALTSALTALRGSLAYQYAAGTPQSGDRLLVELYEVGQLNPSGLLTTAVELTATDRVEGSWQYLSWEVTDPTVISQLKSLGRAVLVFSMVSGSSPGTTRLWLDDLNAEQCVPTTRITGRVTRGGIAAPGALLTLLATSAGGTNVVAQTRSIADGSYDFSSVPIQPGGTTYRVWFLNRPETPPRQGGQLGFWAGPTLPQLSAGQALTLAEFDIADVALQGPASYAEVVATNTAPVALRWSGRAPRTGERHRLCLYDPARGEPTTSLPVQLCGPLVDPSKGETVFRLAPSSFSGAPAFGFRYDRGYRWYVVVYGGDPTTDPNVPFGYSFGERAITLLSGPGAGAVAPPVPDAGDPAPGAGGADWTLLIYMAADNAIGDPRRAPSIGRPSGQLASLPALARAYPGVQVVSYVDRYGPGGAEVCAYPVGEAPDCRTRAEVNSADPQTLADFISFGRGRYPAARTALLIVTPGQAAGELALDETTAGGPTLNLAELRAAYQAAGLGGAAKLDLVIYQAPLLGSAEVLRATAPYARYMVASPEQVWQLGPYRELVPLMAGTSRGDAAAVARGAVTAYARTIAAAGGTRASVWAAYDLSRASALDAALNASPGGLAFEILGYLNASQATVTRRALGEARAAAQSYDSSGNGRLDSLATATSAIAAEEDALVDARDLARSIQVAVGMPESIGAAAGRLAALLDSPATSPVIATAVRSGQSIGGAQIELAGARGLAVFFASGERLGGQPALAEAALYGSLLEQPGDSLWADMVRSYLAAAPGAGPGGVTEGAGGGAQFRPLPGGFVGNPLYLPFVGR